MSTQIDDPPLRCDLLVRHAYVVTMDDDRTVYADGAVAVTDGRIVAVGTDRELGRTASAETVIDAGGGVVHPGFVDTHVHSMNTSRGFTTDSTPLDEGMSLNRRWWAATEPEDEHASALLVASEMLSNGTTCFIEAGTVHHPDTVADAMTTLGIRGIVADPFLWDRGVPGPGQADPRAPRSTGRALETLGGQLHRNDLPDALVRGGIAVFGYGSASDELLVAAKQVARDAGVVFTVHQSFAAGDIAADVDIRGEEPLLHLAKLGILDSRTLLSHMNVLSTRERHAVRDADASVAWCPSCSMVWGSGASRTGRHAELRSAGVNVALGSDGATSSCRYDIPFQGLLASLVSRDREGHPGVIGAEDILEMGTIAGARALGMEDTIGVLAPGYRADLVVRSSSLPEIAPGVDSIRTLVYSAGSKSVSTVIVDGRVVFEDGRVTGMEPGEISELARASARRMGDRLGLRTEPRWKETR